MQQRGLQTSPTAATLNQYRSASSFEAVPPLVSMNDKTLQGKNVKRIDDQMKATPTWNIKEKQPKYNSRLTAERKDNNTDSNINKGKNRPKHSPKRVISSQMNPVKHIYSSKNKPKQANDNQLHLLGDLPQKQQSFAQSVYLDLEEYSSIHKYESISPYHQQFDEDKEYAKFLGQEPHLSNNIIESLGNININLEAEQSIAKSRHKPVPRLVPYQQNNDLADSNDTYNEIIEPLQPKMKRIQSSTYEHGEKNVIVKQMSLQPVSSAENLQQISENLEHKHSAQFRNFQSDRQDTAGRQSNRMPEGAMSAIGLQVFNTFLPQIQRFITPEHQHISIVHEFSLQPSQMSSRILAQIEPEWFSKNTAENCLRLMLTRQNKLVDYLKYLSQLEGRIRKHKTHKDLKRICSRNDKESLNQSPKEVTVHYEKEHSSSKIDKIKAVDSQPRRITKDSIISAKSAVPASFSYPMASTLSETGRQSAKSRQINSQYASTFNVFTSSHHKLKQYPQVISQVQSEKDRDSYKLAKKKKKTCKDEVEVLKLLQLLLVKLADKKCNVYVKQNSEDDKRSMAKQDDETLQSASRLRLKNKQASRYNLGDSFNVIPLEIGKIEFDQYLTDGQQGKTSSTKQSAMAKKIKQLENVLQAKQKYLFEVKSDYDYVINNYITTIANLKNAPQKQESQKGTDKVTGKMEDQDNDQISESKKQMMMYSVWSVKREETVKNESKDDRNSEKLGDDIIHYSRQSQPMTFQMSKHGNESYIEQDQWMGNPTSVQPSMDTYMTGLRRSLPQKN